jgi:hypothetical protein
LAFLQAQIQLLAVYLFVLYGVKRREEMTASHDAVSQLVSDVETHIHLAKHLNT